MKPIAFALLFGASLFASTVAFANADDAKWVAQCVKDNQDEHVSINVITKYCACMDNKMSDNETRSITEWEKSHPVERHECDRESGWR